MSELLGVPVHFVPDPKPRLFILPRVVILRARWFCRRLLREEWQDRDVVKFVMLN